MNNKQAKKLRKAAKAISLVQQTPEQKIYNNLKQIHKGLNKNQKSK